MSTTPSHDNPGGNDHAPTPMDRYLDGLMSADEARAFETSMTPEQARGVEVQRRIDASLRARFSPPAAMESMTPSAPEVAGVIGLPDQGSARSSRTRQRQVMLAVAASIAVIAGVGGGWWWLLVGVEAPYRQPAQIYAAQAANNFTPEWVCTTDQEFAATVRERFGHGAVLPMATPGVQIVGWAYNTPVLSNKTAALLTRVDGQDIVVLIDAAERDVNLRRPGDGGQTTPLHLFKRRLGPLVLYEVSPLDSPRVIQGFVAAD